MAEELIEKLRLTLMQDFLPVGIAMVKRARQGGAGKVVEAFSDSNNPFQDLRQEGESDARSLRERLDQVSPGLGNPVVPVSVSVDSNESTNNSINDQSDLLLVLSRIENGLEEIEGVLSDEIYMGSVED